MVSYDLLSPFTDVFLDETFDLICDHAHITKFPSQQFHDLLEIWTNINKNIYLQFMNSKILLVFQILNSNNHTEDCVHFLSLLSMVENHKTRFSPWVDDEPFSLKLANNLHGTRIITVLNPSIVPTITKRHCTQSSSHRAFFVNSLFFTVASRN